MQILLVFVYQLAQAEHLVKTRQLNVLVLVLQDMLKEIYVFNYAMMVFGVKIIFARHLVLVLQELLTWLICVYLTAKQVNIYIMDFVKTHVQLVMQIPILIYAHQVVLEDFMEIQLPINAFQNVQLITLKMFQVIAKIIAIQN